MNKKINFIRITAFAACFLMLISTFAPIRSAGESNIPCQSNDNANAVYLYNIEEDRSYFQKNIDSSLSPASTVKLMTALVAIEKISDLSGVYTITNAVVSYTDMNVMSLKVGETISARDLLRAMICSGYNDAAVALAIFSCGSIESFVNEMNRKAEALGAQNTLYKDPTGLDDTARTTARDTCLIAKAFFEQKVLLDISSTPSFTIPATNMSSERKIYNRNALISGYTGTKYLNANAVGMNAGMTDIGGYCLATAAQKNGMTYICIVMGAKYDTEREIIYSYVIANELINYVTKTMGARIILRKSDILSAIPVSGANIKNNSVDVASANDISALLPGDYINDDKFKMMYIYEKEELTAPVKKGERVGMIVVCYGNDVVGVHDIVTAEDIERDGFISIIEGIRGFLVGKFFISTVVCFTFLLFVYSVVVPAISRKRKRRSRRYNGYK